MKHTVVASCHGYHPYAWLDTQACTSLDVDLITFDLARRLPFRLRPAALAAAVKRGMALELCYAPALRDEASRRNLFGNAAGEQSHIVTLYCPLWTATGSPPRAT